MKNALTILDVGCKFGIHPSNVPLLELADHHLIDADAEEISHLNLHYSRFKNVFCSCYAMTTQAEALEKDNILLNILSHPGGNTFLTPDPNNNYWKEFRAGSGNQQSTSLVKTNTVDKYCHDHNILPRFLKVDVEGYEHNVLDGSRKILDQSILGVRVEIEFNSLYLNKQGSFTEVDKILQQQGFRFFNFDFFSNSFLPFSEYFNNSIYGQLVGCDAIYMKPLLSIKECEIDILIDYSIFAVLNGIEDLSIRTLLDATKHRSLVKQLTPKMLESNIIERIDFLKTWCAKLFFSLRDKPRFSLEEFSNVWRQIFDEEWLSHGDYYRRFPLT